MVKDRDAKCGVPIFLSYIYRVKLKIKVMENKMTVEQVNEKFKDVKVTFDSYYKFTFTFIGKSEDGFEVACLFGGSSDDIYRFDVNTDPVSFGDCDQWSHVVIKDKEGNKVFSESFGW